MAEQNRDKRQIVLGSATLANALHQVGRTDDARELFARAEELQNEIEPGNPYLYSAQGALYCDLLLEFGEFDEVFDRAMQGVALARRNGWVVDAALDLVSLGSALLGRENLEDAARSLDEGISGLRRTAAQEHLPRALLARAALFTGQRQYAAALRDTNEAAALADWTRSRLLQVDCHLEGARIQIGFDEFAAATNHVAAAIQLIDATKYLRRRKAAEELENRLAKLF